MDVSTKVTITDHLEFESSILREVGEDAIWSLSSVKSGNCVEQIRDNNIDTYWQSDGAQPHLLNIQFINKTVLSKMCLYLDYKQDESYTPKKILIRIGTCVHDLVDFISVDINEPVGWVNIPLNTNKNTEENKNMNPEEKEKLLYMNSMKTFFVQVRFLTMHQNGKDVHIRCIKLYSPRKILMHSSNNANSNSNAASNVTNNKVSSRNKLQFDAFKMQLNSLELR